MLTVYTVATLPKVENIETPKNVDFSDNKNVILVKWNIPAFLAFFWDKFVECFTLRYGVLEL